MRPPQHLTKLSALEAEPAGPLPTEFLIFRAGENPSSKGPAVFDAEAARLVMAAYAEWGVDLMIDRNHDSIERDSRAMRADAQDAMGWFNLEVRDGALWAINVRWTPEGEERLRSKKQRYISPAFHDTPEGRVTDLLNVALVAMPATHDAPALVAAQRDPRDSATRQEKSTVALARKKPSRYAAKANSLVRHAMNPENAKKALEIIAAEDGAAALELLKSIVVESAGGGEAPAPEAAGEVAEPDPEKDALAALGAAVIEITGSKDASNAITAFRGMRERLDRLDADREALDLTERRGLVAELVKLGVETPATAWQGEPEKRDPCKRLAAEPIAELRSRVEVMRAARGEAPTVKPPKGPPAKPPIRKLSKDELAYMKKHSLTAEQFAEHKASLARRSA